MFVWFVFFRAAKNLIAVSLNCEAPRSRQPNWSTRCVTSKIKFSLVNTITSNCVGWVPLHGGTKGDYDVYLVRCKFLSSFHRCKLDIKKLASMTSVSRSSWYHCNYKGILVVSKNQNLKEFSYLNKGLFFFHIEDLVTLVFMKLYSLYSSWWVDRKLN